jgi:hypothetical protein
MDSFLPRITALSQVSRSIVRFTIVAALAVGSSACGGGGGSSAPANHAPTANAGNAQTVFKRAQATLDGSGSNDADGNPLSYAWTQTGGTSVLLSSSTSAKPTFTAPGISGALTFQLIVSDGQISSAPSNVTFTVANRAPTAATTANGTVAAATSFSLDGTGSSDPDGDALIYTWTQTSGASVALVGPATGRPSFVAPGSADTLVFQLIVSDGEAQSAPVTETVAVQGSVSSAPPVANAGGDQTSPKRAAVTLFGYGSTGSGALAFQWQQSSGTSVTLDNPSSAEPTFIAPDVQADLVFALVVSSAGVSSQPSFVTIHVVNNPPVIAGLTLPAAPRRNDAIAASASISDADQDPLTVSYVWKRNGKVVTDATGPAYPPGNQVKGDVIAVQVSASDGTETVTANASTTIADTPTVLTGTAPTTATYGMPVAFSVTASDVDGDPTGAVEVEYGPAGFVVSAAGAVTWTPSGPMFDRSVDQNWSVRLHDSPTVHMTGTITVSDAARKYSLMRTNMGIPNSDSTIDVQDFDNTGRAQALIGSGRILYLFGKSGADYVQTWAYPFESPDSSPIAAVASGDADGDGHREIFFAAGSSIVKLDGVNRREVARYPNVTCTALKYADIDLDGVGELICLGTDSSISGYSSLYVLNAKTMQLKWRTAGLNLGTSLAVGNIDADPALELVTNNGYVFDGVTQQNEWAYGPGFGAKVDIGNVSGDGVNKIVGIISWTAIRVYSATLKSPVWEIDTTNSSYGTQAVRVDNLDGVGPAEIVVGDAQWGNVTVYRYNSGTQGADLVTQTNSLGDGVSAIGIGDMDGDGKKEIVWGSDYVSSGRDYLAVASWTPALAVQWSGPTPAVLDGPFVGAKNAHLAANQDRLMFLTASSQSGYGGTRLMAMDPATGLVGVSDEVDSNWSHNSAFDIGDVFGSGIDSVLVGTATLYTNYFTAYDFDSNSKLWMSDSFTPGTVAITHADLTGDGVADAVGLTADGHVYVWDIKHQTLVWSSAGNNGGLRVAVADLDGDGVKEIVALTGDRVVVYARAGAGGYVERASYPVSGMDLLVADTDGDGKPEVYVLNGGTTLLKLDNNLNLLSSSTIPPTAAIYLEDSAFARKNIVLSGSGSSYPYPTAPAQLLIVDPTSGSPIWASTPIPGTVWTNSLSFRDVNNDGKLEMVFGTSLGMFVTQ